MADHTNSERKAGWDVDRAQDPQAYVRFLDRAGARPHIQELRERSYALLEARPGLRLLDAGCGVGDDARALARLVSPSGSVTGLDASAVMVAEAIRRSEAADPTEEASQAPVAFIQGDVHALPFPDASFDGCRAERLLQHVADPETALAELVRVARPGAMVVVVDSDHGMMGLNGTDRDLTARVLAHWAFAIANGWAGRQLSGLFARLGLRDISVFPSASAYTTLAPHRAALQRCVDGAARRGVITAGEAAAFMADLDALDRAGAFLLSGVMFVVAGRK